MLTGFGLFSSQMPCRFDQLSGRLSRRTDRLQNSYYRARERNLPLKQPQSRGGPRTPSSPDSGQDFARCQALFQKPKALFFFRLNEHRLAFALVVRVRQSPTKKRAGSFDPAR